MLEAEEILLLEKTFQGSPFHFSTKFSFVVMNKLLHIISSIFRLAITPFPTRGTIYRVDIPATL